MFWCPGKKNSVGTPTDTVGVEVIRISVWHTLPPPRLHCNWVSWQRAIRGRRRKRARRRGRKKKNVMG